MRIPILCLISVQVLFIACNKTDTIESKSFDVFAINSILINGSDIKNINDLKALFESPNDTIHYEMTSNIKINILTYANRGLQFYVFEDDSVSLYSVNFEFFDGVIDHPKLVLEKGITIEIIRENFKSSFQNRHRYLYESSDNTKFFFKDGTGLGEIVIEFENDSLKYLIYNIYPDRF
jgi:hypothetical protein